MITHAHADFHSRLEQLRNMEDLSSQQSRLSQQYDSVVSCFATDRAIHSMPVPAAVAAPATESATSEPAVSSGERVGVLLFLQHLTVI